MKHLLAEALETTLHFDSKTFNTVKYLLLRPGFLSGEFNAGRRVAFVPPVRLYVLISFMFFFLLSVLSGGHSDGSEHLAGSEHKLDLSYSFQNIKTSELTGLSRSQVDSLMVLRNVEPTKVNKYMVRQLHKMANGSSAGFTHVLMKNLSYMMFLLMPLFGGFIYMLNKKRIAYYIDSLVISIHFHSFVFFMFTILLVVSAIAANEIFFFLEFLIIPLYMMLMLKGVLKQGWLVTMAKTAVIGVLYLVSLVCVLLLTVLISIAVI